MQIKTQWYTVSHLRGMYTYNFFERQFGNDHKIYAHTLLSNSISGDAHIYAVQYSTLWQHLITEHLKGGLSELRCTLCIKYTLNSKHLVQRKNVKYLIINFL